ncbi:MAG: Archaebacterial flagellin [Methanoregulaceae archaeon PtaB.Bin056]|jgi:flagellar protein FlaG|nr:MAG: Archaebacterial flagellin [Methanoregulaceae archaeon PtaB.Bin056]
MSSETIVTALFLIAAVVAAGVLISALFPAIHRTTSTFGAVSHEADVQIRTDIKIVNTYANATTAKIWLKNVGTARISKNELDQADVFIGKVGDFNRQSLGGLYDPVELGNNFWDQGETLSITIPQSYSSGDTAYFSIVLPNGVRRSEEFGVTIPP